MRNNQTLAELIRQLSGQGTEKVRLAITDIDGILRGKLISFDKFRSVAEKGFGFCDVVFGWDSGDQAYDNAAFTGWHTGYPDAQAVVDIDSFRQVPWEGGIPFFLADFRTQGAGGPGGSGKPGEPEKQGAAGSTVGADNALPVCPRGLLKKVIRQAREAGYQSFFSQEFEWYNFIAPGDGSGAGSGAGARAGSGGGSGTGSGGVPPTSLRDLQPMSQGMFGYSILRASQGSAYFNDLFDQLKKFGVPLEGLHTETGPGVYEAAILYSDPLEAADRAVLFKTGVKEIASRHGILPTFMAKVSESLPGCSGHVHQSLWSADGSRNLFHDPQSATQMSALMESYIAGQLTCLPYILPLYAPTVNSYKRLVEGAWAPTTLTWAIDNRTHRAARLPEAARRQRDSKRE